MNKLLTRILTGLVAVFAVLSLFSFLVVKLSNQVRFEHYWTDMTSPVMRYLSQHEFLLHSNPSSSLSLVAKNQQAISEIVVERLEGGQVVVSEQGNRIKAWIQSSVPELLLELDFRSDGEELYHLYLGILSPVLEQLDLTNGNDRRFVAEQLGVKVDPLTEEGAAPQEHVLEAIVEQSRYLKVGNDAVNAFLRLSDGSVVGVEFPAPLSAMSFFVACLLIALWLVSLAAFVYLMMQGLDRQLRNVETVASRIARGELEARVKRASEEDAVSRLGLAFNSMADHIQRLMYIQKEMIHAVSHELRTPVARIRFGVQMIEDCPDKDSLRKQLQGIDGDIQELDELIDEILTYARLEQGGPILAFHEVDVMEIVEQVVSEQSSVKPELKIFSEYNTGSEQWKSSEVEARYIHRSIQNLVGNATRYAKSKVRVVCSFDKDTCRVDVEDDGPGIPEEDWESVFTPFARLDDSRTRASGGYGLGLSIVRRILYWHGGQAFLGRSEMGGAKFSLVWPRKQQAPG